MAAFQSADDALRGLFELREFLTNPHGPQLFTTKRTPAKECKKCGGTEYHEMREYAPRAPGSSEQHKVTKIRCRKPDCHEEWSFTFEFVRKPQVSGSSRRGDHDEALALMTTLRVAYDRIPYNDRCIWETYLKCGAGRERTAALLNTPQGQLLSGLHTDERHTQWSVRQAISRARSYFEKELRQAGLLVDEDVVYATQSAFVG